MDCDLKIGIGCLIPNHLVEFGGGAKIILPGVSGIDSIYHNHKGIWGKAEMGKKFQSRIEGDEVLQDMEETAKKAGLDMKIDVLINHKREIIRMFVGDFVIQRRRGVEEARKLYATSILKECDVVITNTYPTESQAVRGIWPANLSLKEGGYSVVVVESADGQALHYGGGRFGTNYGGRMWKPPQKLISNAERILICSSYLARTDLDMWGSSDRVLSCATWREVLIHLTAAYPQKAKVAVYPYSSIQVPKEN
jgi:nickel-dependent lactate racemase